MIISLKIFVVSWLMRCSLVRIEEIKFYWIEVELIFGCKLV